MTKTPSPARHAAHDPLAGLSLADITQMLREARAQGPEEIERACALLSRCKPPSKCVRAVLGYPHPAFVRAIVDRFGKTTFSGFKDCPELTYDERNTPTRSAQLDLLDLDELKEVLPLLYRDSKDPYWVLPALLRQARRHGDIMLFADLVSASALDMAHVMSYIDAISPWEHGSPALVAWCADQYRACFPAGSDAAAMHLLGASMFANIHDYCALFVLGQDMSNRTPRAMAPESWAEAFHALASSNHGELTLKRCLATLTVENIFSMTAEQLRERIDPAIRLAA